MYYAITVELGDPSQDNDVLLEALSILKGRRLDTDGDGQQWFADTPLPLTRVQSFLLRHSRDEDRIRVVPLPGRPRMLKHAESRVVSLRPSRGSANTRRGT